MEFQNTSMEKSWKNNFRVARILFCIDHGKMAKESWRIMEKSWNLIPENRWEP